MYYTAMARKIRNESGQFELKGDEPRSVRSLRLTDSCWDSLGELADTRGMSRADVLESMSEDGYFEEYKSADGEARDEIIESIREVIESLQRGNDPLIEVSDHRHKANYRRAYQDLIDYLESM